MLVLCQLNAVHHRKFQDQGDVAVVILNMCMLEVLDRVVSAPSIAASIFLFCFLADVKSMLLTGHILKIS